MRLWHKQGQTKWGGGGLSDRTSQIVRAGRFSVDICDNKVKKVTFKTSFKSTGDVSQLAILGVKKNQNQQSFEDFMFLESSTYKIK